MFLTSALCCNWLWHPWATGIKGHCYSPCLSVCGAEHNLSKVRLFMHCMYLLWTHTCLIIKSEQNVPLGQHAHSCTTSPSLLFLPKSTPDGDVVMSDPLSQCAMVSSPTLLQAWVLSEIPLGDGRCLLFFLSVTPAAFIPEQRKVKDAGEILCFWPS